MTENEKNEIARIGNLINDQLEGIEVNMSINVLTNILIVQIINASPEESTLSWIKNKCNELSSDMYNFIEIIYKEKFPDKYTHYMNNKKSIEEKKDKQNG